MLASEGEEAAQAPTDVVLGWHRVCLNTIVRATRELESARLRILPMGSRVNVVEVAGRRVRIDQPIDGWCSIESSNGDLILSPTQTDGGGMANENEQTAMQGRAEQLAQELSELKWLRAEVAGNRDADANQKLQHAKIKVEDLKNREKRLALLVSNQPTEVERQAALSELEKEINSLQNLQSQINGEQSEVREEIRHLSSAISPNIMLDANTIFQNGDVVMLKDKSMMIVRYSGTVHWDESGGDYLGVECSHAIGDNDGTVSSVEYFQCEQNHGKFVKITEVEKKIPAESLLKMLHEKVKQMEQSRTAQDRKSVV